jgi:broad specificity phosphatase PhoE
MTYFALVLALLVPRQATRPAQIILFRHAEKPADKADPHLSPEGVQRARKLVGFLATNPVVNKYGKPVAIFATKTTKDDDGQRTQETVAPAAASLKLAVQTPFVGKDYKQLVKLILGNPAYAGKTVVICWNHDVISELAAELGAAQPPPWKGKEYDQVYVITWRGRTAVVTVMKQNLGPA